MGPSVTRKLLLRVALLLLLGGATGYAAGPMITGLMAAQTPPSDFVPVDVGGESPLLVQKEQVTTADWLECVADRACPDVPVKSAAHEPMFGINVLDVQAYIQWRGQQDRISYRLPTHEEWLLLAAEQVPQAAEALFKAPELSWAADFRIGDPNPVIETPNEFGIEQLRDKTWEWTASCSEAGEARTGNCESLRIAMGNHKAILSVLARDTAKAGCGGGTPPARVGFRLVADG